MLYIYFIFTKQITIPIQRIEHNEVTICIAYLLEKKLRYLKTYNNKFQRATLYVQFPTPKGNLAQDELLGTLTIAF